MSSSEPPPLFRLAAIDPGERWCGLAEFDLAPLGGRLLGDGFVDQSRRGKIRLMRCRTLTPPSMLYHELEEIAPRLHFIALERFQLYPWMAREQGFSEFETAQCIGVVKYIAAQYDIPVYLQDAKGVLRGGRAHAEKHGFKMEHRVLGTGRFKYRGPDFKLPGKPHRRDAASHGVWWSVNHHASPLR